MNDILTYIDWRGDLSLAQSDFNEVDSLILSMLSYLELADIVPPPGEGAMPLREAAARYFERRPAPTEPPKPGDFERSLQWLLVKLADAPRFRDMALSGAVNVLDSQRAEQFYAITIQPDDRRVYVAYRGTDDNLAGWKEDFLLACLPEIPAQRDALSYLERAAALHPDKALLLGGHSKGGNLAVYAAVQAPEAIQSRIEAVWSNDGPGFLEPMETFKGYRRVADVVHAIVPKSSVVGMLLSHKRRYRIVDSSQAGLFQHDGFSWQVSGPRFVTLPSLTEQSERANEAIRDWLHGITLEERRQFVDCLFDMLYATGATSLSQIRKDRGLSLLASLPHVKGISRENREHIVEFLLLMLQVAASLNISMPPMMDLRVLLGGASRKTPATEMNGHESDC